MKYLVVEQGYSYDDETYSEEEGYQIKSKLYNTRKEAQEKAKELTIDFICNNSHYSKITNKYEKKYSPELFNIFEYIPYEENVLQFLKSIGSDVKDRYEGYFPKNITEEQIFQCLEISNTKFFFVIEIEE